MRARRTGPNSETVARNLTPSCLERVINSTGKPFTENGILIFECLSRIKGFASPGFAIYRFKMKFIAAPASNY